MVLRDDNGSIAKKRDTNNKSWQGMAYLHRIAISFYRNEEDPQRWAWFVKVRDDHDVGPFCQVSCGIRIITNSEVVTT